jgi:phenylalanyl-tRNA synthetase beta chain
MTVVTLNRKEVEKKLGKIDEKIEEKISMFGTPVESLNETEVSIEVFPNRPDLLSLQGFLRAMSYYLNGEKLKQYKVNKPEKDFKVKIDKAVKSVRPFIACAIVKNLKFDSEKIKEIIDIQEKLHLTLGRRRKKLAIGIYPLEKIKLPITYTAKKPEDIKFIPLEADREMNGRQILSRHPTGREYAHLLDGLEVFPVFVDSNNKVLSMPPIINSHETGKITEQTKDVFIECSGSNLFYLQKTMNIIVTALADMSGEIYGMDIEDSKNWTSPNLSEEKVKFRIEDINKTLGLKLEEKDIKSLLEKMGVGYETFKGESIALIPAYRTDILHWIDLTEEVGIAYGYNKFESEIPQISTIAEEDKRAIIKRTISEILSGLGLIECSSFHLTTKSDIKNVYFDYKDFIEVEDSKTEYNVLRMDILNNLIKILSENSDSNYPQKIFELGKTFSLNKNLETGIEEKEKLAIAIADEQSNFTEAKKILDYLFKMIDKNYTLEACENQNYISGRVGKIMVERNNEDKSSLTKSAVNLAKNAASLAHINLSISTKEEVGFIGEISPRVLNNFKIKMPVSAFEIDLDKLFR